MTYSTTITSKGQITLPAILRQQLKLLPGLKVTVKLHGKQLIIDAPIDIDDIRMRNQAHMLQNPGIDISDRAIDDVMFDVAKERYQRSMK